MGTIYYDILITTIADVFTAKANNMAMNYKGNNQFRRASTTFIEGEPVVITVYNSSGKQIEKNTYLIQ